MIIILRNLGDVLQRKILVFHELAHCSLNRDHDTRTYNDGMPYSIMYPVINQIIPFFQIYENYYLTELSNNSIGGNDPFLYKINNQLKDLTNKSKYIEYSLLEYFTKCGLDTSNIKL